MKTSEPQLIKKIKSIFSLKGIKKTIRGPGTLKEEIDEIINPLYQYLLSKILVKTWKKFAEKEMILMKHKRLIKNYNN